MIRDIETLVELVVARASVDKTAPDPGNLRNGWHTDALLIGDVDALVVGENPGAYAEIGRRVLARISGLGLPEMEMLAKIAIFRGERLLPLDANREQGLALVAEELRTAIDALPDGPRKMRLSSLLSYNVGVFCDACGHFDLAAQMQVRSAEEAMRFGDKAGAAIAWFLRDFYSLKASLYSGTTPGAEAHFLGMEGSFSYAIEALRDSPLQVLWAEGNLPLHMLEACIWLNLVHKDWGYWVESVRAASAKLGGVWHSIERFVWAVNMALDGYGGAVDDALNAVANGDAGAEIKATALLVLARAAMASDTAVAATIVRRMPEQGMQHVRAVASRLFP